VDGRPESQVNLLDQHLAEGLGASRAQAALLEFLGKAS
jgi:hypothetical protein